MQLAKSLKQKSELPLIFYRWYCLLNYIKSITEPVMFKITNVNVGLLYTFWDFTWCKGELNCVSNYFIMRFFYYDYPQLCSQWRRWRFLTLTWLPQLGFVILGYIFWHSCKHTHYCGSVTILDLKFEKICCTHVCYIPRTYIFSLKFGLHWNSFVFCSVLHTCEKVDFV